MLPRRDRDRQRDIPEFRNVTTRPVTSNGLGFSLTAAAAEVAKLELVLTLLPHGAAIYHEWKRLVTQHGVLGSKVHDARLVAVMNVQGVRRILTFSVNDFARYPIEVLYPPALEA